MRIEQTLRPAGQNSTLRKGYSVSNPAVNWRRSSRFIGAYQITCFVLRFLHQSGLSLSRWQSIDFRQHSSELARRRARNAVEQTDNESNNTAQRRFAVSWLSPR